MWVPVLEFVAVLAAALFAGAALYISVVEHPARMSLDTRVAAMQWAPSYERATWLQAPLAIASLLCGAAVWLLGFGAGAARPEACASAARTPFAARIFSSRACLTATRFGNSSPRPMLAVLGRLDRRSPLG